MVNNSALPAELMLVAACCRWPPSAARRSLVAQRSQSETDWQRVVRIAARHRVTGLVSQSLREARVAVPGDVAAQLSQAENRIALTNVRAAAETHRTTAALGAAGIDVIVLKGVTLNALAYGSLALKESRDIDLLVAPGDFGKASAVLAGAGYRRLSPAPELGDEAAAAWMARSKESAWTHPAGHLVELHIALADNDAMIPGIGMDSPRQTVGIGGGLEVETLADSELLAYLFVHGATHGWARLKWLADVNALLVARNEAEIGAAYRGALALGAGRSAGQALVLCERLFGLGIGAGLAREIGADRRTRMLVRIAMNLIAGRYMEAELDDSRFGTIPLHFAHFLMQKGLRPKFGILAQKLRTPFRPDEGKRGLIGSALSIPVWLWRRGRMRHRTGH